MDAKPMLKELDAFSEVVRRLEENRFAYMLTGSWAMNYWAVPRASNDADLVVALSVADAERFVAAFEADFYIDVDMARDAIRRRSMFNIIYQPIVFKFDIIVQKGDSYSREAFRRRVRFAASADGDPAFWVSSPEDLIISKLDWYRDGNEEDSQQYDDVVNVLVSRDELDRAYLDNWVDSLDLRRIFDRAMKDAQAEREDGQRGGEEGP